mgnify:CR=1 FL=1
MTGEHVGVVHETNEKRSTNLIEVLGGTVGTMVIGKAVVPFIPYPIGLGLFTIDEFNESYTSDGNRKE